TPLGGGARGGRLYRRPDPAALPGAAAGVVLGWHRTRPDTARPRPRRPRAGPDRRGGLRSQHLLSRGAAAAGRRLRSSPRTRGRPVLLQRGGRGAGGAPPPRSPCALRSRRRRLARDRTGAADPPLVPGAPARVRRGPRVAACP